MFETNDMAKLENPLSLLGDENYLWSHVSLRIHIPWFYLIYSVEVENKIPKRDILFITNINDLINIHNEPQMIIEHVYLVSPGHLNKSDQWMMEPIENILSGIEPDHDQLAHVAYSGPS